MPAEPVAGFQRYRTVRRDCHTSSLRHSTAAEIRRSCALRISTQLVAQLANELSRLRVTLNVLFFAAKPTSA